MWWTILFSIVGLYVILRFVMFIFGNWRSTLNKVITQYVAWKQMEPDYSDEQIFMTLLDHRYPEGSRVFARMNGLKNEIKAQIKTDVEGGMSVIDKFSLPILIYACLSVEENSYLNSSKSVEELLEPIIEEVKRQGFEKYC